MPLLADLVTTGVTEDNGELTSVEGVLRSRQDWDHEPALEVVSQYTYRSGRAGGQVPSHRTGREPEAVCGSQYAATGLRADPVLVAERL